MMTGRRPWESAAALGSKLKFKATNMGESLSLNSFSSWKEHIPEFFVTWNWYKVGICCTKMSQDYIRL